MASVIGVVIALLVVFVILVIILLYAYKSHKMCFKDTSKLNKIDASNQLKNGQNPSDNHGLNDKIWPENPNYQVYSPNGYHLDTSSTKRHSTTTTSASSASSSRTTTPSKSVESVNKLLYAELQFPVTSNYGSMKKRNHHRSRLRAAAAAAAADKSCRVAPEDVTHAYNCQTNESLQLSET
ncbi:unnamed protein product [Lepeophtheirus salmonis]|uniref:(salmon louse) hypothetical protein n=1 Tax=Lepeophtheirus salmonis TaxID=72036 RepID=A0A7R8H4X5_LEPSM|nr:unnamed protein product [Lepeophtheirus salmonis]CAF2858051.1 unnamed protein product [Lepeophtheirus salmonis]